MNNKVVEELKALRDEMAMQLKWMADNPRENKDVELSVKMSFERMVKLTNILIEKYSDPGHNEHL